MCAVQRRQSAVHLGSLFNTLPPPEKKKNPAKFPRQRVLKAALLAALCIRGPANMEVKTVFFFFLSSSFFFPFATVNLPILQSAEQQ